MQYMGKFLPETKLVETEDGSYYIKQKYIEGRLLKFTDVSQLSGQTLTDLLELLNGYIRYCEDEGKEIDIIGCQHDVSESENVRKRRFYIYSRILKGFLSSTNIIISSDNRVYMVDVCDTIPLGDNSKIDRIKKTVRQAIVKLGTKISKQKISRLINEKKKDLCNALS